MSGEVGIWEKQKKRREMQGTGEEREIGIESEVKTDSYFLNEKRSRGEFFDKRKKFRNEASVGEVRWLTTPEAAQYLRVSTSSLKTMIYRGQVRVHKLGRRNRFLREELDRTITLPNP